MSLDNFIANGSAHTCPTHRVQWYDVDGACPQCLAECDEVTQEAYERAVRDLVEAIGELRAADLDTAGHVGYAHVGLRRYRVTVQRVTP